MAAAIVGQFRLGRFGRPGTVRQWDLVLVLEDVHGCADICVSLIDSIAPGISTGWWNHGYPVESRLKRICDETFEPGWVAAAPKQK